MAKAKQKEAVARWQPIALELLDNAIHFPTGTQPPPAGFTFSIDLESQPDAGARTILISVRIKVRISGRHETVGSLALNCIYSIANFEAVVPADASGRLHIPTPLLETLNSVSVSTARGVLFASFRGTFLHQAILPAVDTQALRFMEKEY